MAKKKDFAVTPNIEYKTVEDILENLTGVGKFQIGILILLLSLEIPTAFVAFAPVFTGATPDEWLCNNETVFKTDPDFCECNGTLTAISPTTSIVAEWGLVCGASWASDFITTLQMGGMVLGNIITGVLADWYGRKYTYGSAVLWLIIGTVGSAVAPNVYIYGVARLFGGMGFAGYVYLSMSYAMEFMTPNWRALCTSVGPLGEGIMILGALGYYFQDSWRNLYLATAIPLALIVIIFPIIPESPRWLLRNRKIDEAHKVFNYMARVNGHPPIEIDVLWKVGDFNKDDDTEKCPQRIGYAEFFKDKVVRNTTFFLMSIWSTWAIMYFGISFNMKNLGGNPYLNVVFMGLCDAIGYPTAYVMNSIFTRRQSLATFMSGAACFLVTLAILQLFVDMEDRNTLVLTLCLLGKFCASGARACARLLTAESYATEVRNMGGGIVGVSASIVGLGAPQLAYLGARWPAVPLFVFGACSALGACCSFLLKETKGQALKEEVKRKRGFSIISIVDTMRRFSMSSRKSERSVESPEKNLNLNLAKVIE